MKSEVKEMFHASFIDWIRLWLGSKSKVGVK